MKICVSAPLSNYKRVSSKEFPRPWSPVFLNEESVKKIPLFIYKYCTLNRIIIIIIIIIIIMTAVREKLQSFLLSSRAWIAQHLSEREKCDAAVERNGTFCVKYIRGVVFMVLNKSERTCQHYYAMPAFPTSFIILVQKTASGWETAVGAHSSYARDRDSRECSS